MIKTKTTDTQAPTDFSKLSNEELADAFVFPKAERLQKNEKQEEEAFWADRRKQHENQSREEKIYSGILQLKFELEEYIAGDTYLAELNFGYFLNEYIRRQEKPDKQFAAEVDIKPAVLSQYINNHRSPTDKFVIRLELHSNGLITALAWFKLLQKRKEHEIMEDVAIRYAEISHITNKLELAY